LPILGNDREKAVSLFEVELAFYFFQNTNL
jgi:hypothetical protein